MDTKFTTYNFDAFRAFVTDFPMVLALAQKLKDDSTVKPKKRAMMSQLYNKMKDGRNIINLIAAVNVLEIISEYQKWGQLEKASAFERKSAVAKLQQKMRSLNDKHKTKKIVEQFFDFLDFNTKQVAVGSLKVKISWLPNSKVAMMKAVLMRQQKMGKDFMSAKLELHRNEDPVFLPDLSDVFDMQIWKVTKFEKGEEVFDGFLKELLLKLIND